MAKVLVLFVWSFFSDAFPQAIQYGLTVISPVNLMAKQK